MRTIFAFGLGIATALTILPAAGQERFAAPASTRGPSACAGEPLADRLQDVTPQGDLVLASGRLARLAGIRLSDEQLHRDASLAWLRARTEKSVLVWGSRSRDRWDRLTVRVRLSDDSNPLDFGHGLVEAGLAITDPGLEEGFCQPELLAFEETAREQRLGLWADDRYIPIDSQNLDRLQDRVGSFVLVEGRIRSIGERKQRTYLNFGGHWAEDFTIIIPHKIWKLMADRGLGAEALNGRRIRARGILQPWQGMALTIVMPELIERLEGKGLP